MRTVGLAVEQTDACREDLVEAAVSEVDVLDRPDEELGLSMATCSSFLRVAASIIFAEQSIAVSRPVRRRSQTRVAATPCPISSTWSPGRMSNRSTIDLRRSATAEV